MAPRRYPTNQTPGGPTIEGEPVVLDRPKLLCKALVHYNNGGIVGGVGVHWEQGEVKELTWEQYQQICQDNPKVIQRMQ